jgi:hypothetical protein
LSLGRLLVSQAADRQLRGLLLLRSGKICVPMSMNHK